MGRGPTLAIIALLLLVGINGAEIENRSYLQDESIVMNQFGGGTSLEAQCSKSSFEDVFTYTWADFNVTVADNWRTAQIEALAWINGTMADDFRTFLDDLLDGLIPSGGDGWLSSDEREAVRSVAADCVEYTMTRVGVRDGEHHRGGPAVDWRNATWVEDGVSIAEWNMVPERHESARSCSNFGSANCYEVPVAPDESRDCDTDADNPDECRIELMLSGTVDLHNIQSLETLTLAMNTSNISRATYTVNAPYVEGMRLSMFEECEGRDLLNGGSPTPIRGSCIGDGSSVATAGYDELGGMVLTIMPDRPSSFWPAGEDLFFDLTTIQPPTDESPIWTSAAPDNGTTWVYSSMASTLESTRVLVAEWNEIASWFSDEGAVSSLDLTCLEEGSSTNLVTDSRAIVITMGHDSDYNIISCSAEDDSGQTTSARDFHIMKVFSVNTQSDSLDVLEDLSLILSDINTQNPSNGEFLQVGLSIGIEWSGNGPIFYDDAILLNSSDSVAELMFSGDARIATPGPLSIWFKYSGEGVYERSERSGIPLQKIGSPPILSILETKWTETEWEMNGMFSDPDGEDVTFTMYIDGVNIGTVQAFGNTWSVGPIDFRLFDAGLHTVSVRGCDTSGMCAIAESSLNSTLALTSDVSEEIPERRDDDSVGFVPFPIYYSSIGILAAAFMYKRGHRGTT